MNIASFRRPLQLCIHLGAPFCRSILGMGRKIQFSLSEMQQLQSKT
jgi:hypothetical protein